MHPKTSRKSGARNLDSKSLVDEYVAKELSRRQMVHAVMLGSLGAAGLLGCTTKTVVQQQPAGTGTSSSGGEEVPVDPNNPDPNNPDDPNNPPKGGGHLVGMGYDAKDRNKALQAALAETIGLGMIKAGQSVYLRVNSNSGDPFPFSTSPDTILAIGGMLKDIGVTDIRIGDRSFWGDANTAANLQRNGITGAAKKIGVTAEAYDDNVDWITLPAGSVPNWTGTVRLPEPVTSADHQIILSCVKTHFIAGITMSLKISLGLVHAEDRARAGNLKNHDTAVLHKQVAQINKAFTPSLVVMDGYKAVISGGPTVNDKPAGAPANWPAGGVTGDPKVFIVSTDRIAADVAGIAVLKEFSPAYESIMKVAAFQHPSIKAAIAAQLGITSAAEFDLSGPTVPDIEKYRSNATG